MSDVTYEAAMAYVISLRPRLAVEDADAAARRLLELVNPDPLKAAIESQDFTKVALLSPAVMDCIRADEKIRGIKEVRAMTGWGLKEAKDAVETPEVEAHYPTLSPYRNGGWRA